MDVSLVNMSGEPSVAMRSKDPIISIGSLVKRGGIMMILETTVGVYPLSYGEALQGTTASLVKGSCRATVKTNTALAVQFIHSSHSTICFCVFPRDNSQQISKHEERKYKH